MPLLAASDAERLMIGNAIFKFALKGSIVSTTLCVSIADGMPRTRVPTSTFSQPAHDNGRLASAKWMFVCGIPFNAVDTEEFTIAVADDSVAKASGFQVPGRKAMSTTLLNLDKVHADVTVSKKHTLLTLFIATIRYPGTLTGNLFVRNIKNRKSCLDRENPGHFF